MRISFKWISISSLIIACITTAGLAFADYEGGSEGTAGNQSSCLTATNKITWCGAYGVSWRYYTLGNNANASAESRCSAIGVQGYYVLAYEKIQKGSSAGSWSYVGAQAFSPGVQVHQVINPPNVASDGSYNYKYAQPAGALSWSDVQAKHDLAEKYNLIGQDDPAWKDTTWFLLG